jgi:hypothetical protein
MVTQRQGYVMNDEARGAAAILFLKEIPSDTLWHKYNDRPYQHKQYETGVGKTGNNEAHDNMPPFIALYMCKYTG